MGTYFNPPDKLPEVGRKLTGHSFEELKAQLQPGEKLYGLYDRLVFKFAVWLYDADEFGQAEDVYFSGQAVSHAFYALNETFETHD